MKIKGEGRTRLTRFAAITIPATIATAALGVAVLEGAVAATLSSAGGFQLASTQLNTNTLKLRPGTTNDGSAEAVAYAETGATTTLNTLCLGVTQPISIAGVPITKLGLKVSSTDPSVSVPSVSLNAGSLAGGSTTLANVNAGIAQSTVGFSGPDGTNSTTGYVASGFGLTSGSGTIGNLKATSYAITLNSLGVQNLNIGVDATGNQPGLTGECF
jgi:hypothetical protein